MQGTRHRRDKGLELEHQPLGNGEPHGDPCWAREGRSDGVIGASPTRTKVKRRKAYAVGEPALSGKAQNASELHAYWRRAGDEILCS